MLPGAVLGSAPPSLLLEAALDNSTLITRSVCDKCGENYTLAGHKYVQLIELQSAIQVQYRCANPGCGLRDDECRCSVPDLHRTCLTPVPIEETIKVCLPCWRSHQHGELDHYANAPFAGILQEIKIG